jgi:hypothetical protein
MPQPPVPRAPAGHPIDRSGRGQVNGRLKVCLDLVVNEGADPYEAARKIGYHARSMRLALAKPHVLAYLRRARQVLREQARAQNIHFMIKMRAEGSNEMAKLGAMRLIEADDEVAHRSSMPVSPGLQIVIVDRGGSRTVAPTIEHESEPKPPVFKPDEG